jgi:hypothetical protein
MVSRETPRGGDDIFVAHDILSPSSMLESVARTLPILFWNIEYSQNGQFADNLTKLPEK